MEKSRDRRYETADGRIGDVVISQHAMEKSLHERVQPCVGGQDRRPRGLSSVSLVLLVGISESTGQQV